MLIERNKSVISSQDILLKSTTILNFTYKPISSVIAHDWVSCTVLDVFLSWFLHLACSFRLVGLFCVRVRGREEVKHETPERIFLHRDRLLPWRQTSDVTAEIGLLIAQIESVAMFEERGKGEGRNAKSSLRFCLKRKRQKKKWIISSSYLSRCYISVDIQKQYSSVRFERQFWSKSEHSFWLESLTLSVPFILEYKISSWAVCSKSNNSTFVNYTLSWFSCSSVFHQMVENCSFTTICGTDLTMIPLGRRELDPRCAT